MSLKVAVIGVGNIGTAHATTIFNGEVDGMELCALCDIDENRLDALEELFPNVPLFKSSDELLDSKIVDAVIISTPHYFHPSIALKALKSGHHVISEKPLGVYTYGLNELFEAQKENGKLFAVMLNQRTNKLFSLAKKMISDGKIGKIKRSCWIITNWYRTNEYYASGNWRATWQGEGGGVLTNQAPHNLDLWQWLCGMPKSVYAICNEGKYHNIEVEDEATVYAEYENGASGVFITSTGEFPGTNRLEITGELGKIVLEKGTLTLTELSRSERDYCDGKCEAPMISETVISDEEYKGHKLILQNFANAVLKGEKLISPAIDAVNEVLICNASYLSSWTGEKVSLPLDEKKFLNMLKEKIENGAQGVKSSNEDLFAKEYLTRWNTNW